MENKGKSTNIYIYIYNCSSANILCPYLCFDFLYTIYFLAFKTNQIELYSVVSSDIIYK